MEWSFIVALLVAVPIIMFPVVFVWYLNIGGVYTAIREAMWKKTDAPTEPAVEEEIVEIPCGS